MKDATRSKKSPAHVAGLFLMEKEFCAPSLAVLAFLFDNTQPTPIAHKAIIAIKVKLRKEDAVFHLKLNLVSMSKCSGRRITYNPSAKIRGPTSCNHYRKILDFCQATNFQNQ